jgi:hypothetical protein
VFVLFNVIGTILLNLMNKNFNSIYADNILAFRILIVVRAVLKLPMDCYMYAVFHTSFYFLLSEKNQKMSQD